MKKEFFYSLVCLMLFSAANTFAQQTNPASSSSSTGIPDERSAPAPASGNAAAPAAASGATLAEQPVQKAAPMFADSLMQGYKVDVFQSVLKMADLAKFKYSENLEKAKTGDIVSLQKMLDFHRIVDGVDGLNHAVTCLELIPLTGDGAFASAVYNCPPKLKKLLIERLMLAQARTKKTFLRQSLTNWAPITWAFLNEQYGTPAPAEQQPTNTPATNKQ